MESDLRYFQRRAVAEMMAARRSITPEARARHLELAAKYSARAMEDENLTIPAASAQKAIHA